METAPDPATPDGRGECVRVARNDGESGESGDMRVHCGMVMRVSAHSAPIITTTATTAAAAVTTAFHRVNTHANSDRARAHAHTASTRRIPNHPPTHLSPQHVKSPPPSIHPPRGASITTRPPTRPPTTATWCTNHHHHHPLTHPTPCRIGAKSCAA
jgi:hypothetical protein